MIAGDLDRRALALLQEVLEVEPARRRALIERRCVADRALESELVDLLAEASAVHDGFLEVPAVEVLGDRSPNTPDVETSDTARPPGKMGSYRVLDQLGKGGMGTVWLGLQEHPVHRRVALKVIRRVHGRSARHRFAVECQALAKLSHPNVAALYEVGETEDGRPFVAMELIEGQNISEFCRRRKLGLRARLRLFVQVCAAVRHAHEKGILHRDLKPSNILVTEVDGRPLPKVIDFGIARIFDDPLLGSASLPDDRSIVGSPAYMSPEAARGAEAVDTRSDVYSLGLLLYELLAGVLPFRAETQTVLMLRQRASRFELPPPSERFEASAPEERARISANRSLRERSLRQRLRGDLDAIVCRAIAFDPDMRYSSPSDLAADLEKHLENRPVGARHVTWSYVLSRALRRHFVAAAALAAVLLALGTGVVVSAKEARRANLEVERSRHFSSFLVELFALSDPDRDPTAAAGARELLDRGADRLGEELQGQPLDRARLAHAISEVYLRLGLHDRAESLASEALELRQAELPKNHEERLQSLAHLGVIHRHQRRFEASEPLLLQVLEARRAQSPKQPLALAAALNDLGNLEWDRKNREVALAFHLEALEIRRRELGPHDEQLARSLNNVGALVQGMDRDDEAAEYLRQADAIFVHALGENHPVRAAGLNNLGMSEMKLGRWAESEASLRRALAIWRVSLGETHQRTLNAKSNLTRLLNISGRWAESAELLEEIIPALEAQPGQPHRSLTYNLIRLGRTRQHAGDLEAALEALDRAVDVSMTHLGEQHSGSIRSRLNRARVMAKMGRETEAEQEVVVALDMILQREAQDLNLEAFARRELAKILVSVGRGEEAEQHLLRALEADELAPGFASNRAPTFRVLGDLAVERGRPDEARRHFQRSAAIYREEYPPTHPGLAAIERRLEAL